MSSKSNLNKIKRIAEEQDWKFYSGYSGRFMYGKQCAGIVTDNPDKCLKLAIKEGIRCGKTDSMGMGYIVYWPSVECQEEEE